MSLKNKATCKTLPASALQPSSCSATAGNSSCQPSGVSENSSPLTPEEQRCVSLLRQCKGDGVWQITIRNITAAGKPSKVRQLLTELRSQAGDDPKTMEKIIGKEALKVLASIE